MSIIGRDANKNKKCFAACQPGTYCECLGKTIEEKDCGFSDISCILQHMSSVAKSEELVGNLQIAGDIECWVDQIRQLNTTTRPPVAGLAELTDEMRKEAVELIKQSVRDVEAENAAMKVPIRWDGITFGKPDWPCRFDEPQEKFNGNDERYKAGRNDGFQEGWNACVSEVKKLNQPKTEK